MTQIGQVDLEDGKDLRISFVQDNLSGSTIWPVQDVLLTRAMFLPYGLVAEYEESGKTIRTLIPWHRVSRLRQEV